MGGKRGWRCFQTSINSDERRQFSSKSIPATRRSAELYPVTNLLSASWLLCFLTNHYERLKEGGILERCFVMKEQESLGGCSISVLCSAVPRALAHCFLPGEVNVLTQGPSDTHNRLFSECVYYVKRAFDKVKRLHTDLLRKQALRTVCCVFLEGP